MNMYENIIDDAKAKKIPINAINVLSHFKRCVEEINRKVAFCYTRYQQTLDKLAAGGYTQAYIREWEEKERENYEGKLMLEIDTLLNDAKEEFEKMQTLTQIQVADKETSANNILKLQAILPKMNDEDKEQLFECAADKDPNILEILLFDVKNDNPVLADKIMDKLNEYTGLEKIRIVEQEYQQLSGLKSHLTFDMVKSMGIGFSAIEGVEMTIQGTVDRIIAAYVQEINKNIEKIKSMEE